MALVTSAYGYYRTGFTGNLEIAKKIMVCLCAH